MEFCVENKQPILIVGGGGHALSLLDVIAHEGSFQPVGIVERDDYRGQGLGDLPLIGYDDDLAYLRKKYSHAVIGLGQIYTPAHRMRIYGRLKELDFVLPNIISPLAYVADNVVLGEGNVVMHHALINTSVRLGHNCIINSKALIEHGVQIGSHCHISTAAVINGDAQVQDGCFIGSQAMVREGAVVCAMSFVKAMSLFK